MGVGGGSLGRAVLAALACAVAGLACGGDGGGGPDPADEIVSVTVVPPSTEVDVGATVQLAATVRNRRGDAVDAPVSWTSSAPGTATVSASGLVGGVAVGTATITATAGAVSGRAEVVVMDPFPPDAPTDVTAAAVSDATVELGWTDNADNETGFVVERESVGTGEPGDAGRGAGPDVPGRVFSEAGRVDADVTTFRDEGLDPTTSWRYRVLACNDNGCSPTDAPGTTSGTVTTHAALAMETEGLPGGVLGEPYEVTLEATGGSGAFTWSVVDGGLPPGVELAEEGLLSGAPSEAGTFAFTLRVTSGEQLVARAFQVTVTDELLPPRVEDVELPDAVVGQTYSLTLQADRGDGVYAWALAGGGLPAGMDLAEDGTLSGAPTESGAFDFTVEVLSGGLTGTADLTLVVLDFPPVTVVTESLPDGIVGASYEAVVEVSGGDGTYDFEVVEGALPDGLALSLDGVISGSPDAEGTFDFQLRVTSGDGQEATAGLSITITPPGPVSIVNTRVHPAYAGLAYGQRLRATGGDGETYLWSVRSGELPPGLALETDGSFSGSAAATGEFTFTVQVESGGRVRSGSFTLRVVEHDPSAFGITPISVTSPSDAIQEAVDRAIARWEAILVGDLPDFQQGEIEGRFCGGFGELLSRAVVDDVMIIVDIGEIDGPGGTLGFAGPCGFVRTSGLPAGGRLRLDEEDLRGLVGSPQSEETLEGLIFHEIGHILGFGTLWDFPDFFALLDDEGGIDPRFNGEAAVAEYGALGGAGRIPVENDGGPGTRDGHWEETGTGPNDFMADPDAGRQGFENEIMTGFIDTFGMPVSRMTIAAMEDLGYEVSYETADSYFLPSPPPSGAAGGGQGREVLGFDRLLSEPLFVRAADGTVRMVEPRR